MLIIWYSKSNFYCLLELFSRSAENKALLFIAKKNLKLIKLISLHLYVNRMSILLCLSTIFSTAVFEENVEIFENSKVMSAYCCRHAKTLTFSNISLITEGIYLKLRLVVYYKKGNTYQ